jgi:hypothetical protein
MADEELIDSYVHRPSISDDTKFLTGELKSVLDLLEKINSTKVTLNSAKGTSGVVDAAKNAKAAADSLENAKATLLEAKAKKELAAATLLEAKARKENAAASLLESKAKKEASLTTKAEAQARKENATAAIQEQKASDSAAKQKANEQKVIDDLANDYLQLSRAYTDAAKKAKNYSLVLGENHPITIEAVKDAKAMHDILLRVDQSVGQSQRNVGNYKSAFDGLGMSFTQVARELPSLAISTQQFVLAISNNLPMVFDEIKKARTEIAALQAQGQQTPSLLQRVAGSIISWNVGLSVGIALLTAYSGKIVDWVKGLFNGNTALKAAAKEQQLLNEQQEKALELIQKYNSTIKDSRLNVNRTLSDEIALAKARGDNAGKILKMERDLLEQRNKLSVKKFFDTGGTGQLLDLEIQLTKTEKAYEDFLKTGKAFGETLKFGTPEFKEREGQLASIFSLQSRKVEEQKDIVSDFFDTQRELEEKDIEIKKYAAVQRAKFFAAELQYRAEILKNFSSLEEAQELTRVNARKQALKLERAIIEGEHADEIREAKNNEVKIFEANREYTFKRKKLQEDYERDILAIHQTSIAKRREEEKRDNDQFIADQEDALSKQIDAIQKVQERRQVADAEGQQAEINALNKKYQKQIDATKEGSKKRENIEREYAERRADIEYSYALAELKNQIEFAAKLIALRKDTQDVTAEEKRLHELRMQLSDLETKHVIENNKRQERSHREKMQQMEKDISAVRDGYNAAAQFVTGLLSADIDKQKNAVQEQIDLIDKKKEEEINGIHQTTLSEQEKAYKIAVINSRAAADKEGLERRQRQLDLQRARYEKAATIARIAIETALAVVHQLATGDPYTAIARAITAGAIGAAQLAVAIAQPLPKFRHGRDGGPATLAIVGDGGKHEVVTSPDLSQAFVTPDTDTVTFLPKSWKVFPDIDKFQEAAVNMVHKPLPVLPVVDQNNNEGLIRAMAYSIGRLERAVMNKRETHFHWDNGELHKSIKNGNDWWRYIQSNI